ncbi:unnamed protein product [Meganyctiphanes norvegica]|uniref:Uncharacterized protein n=1 Tax=Meganyctiphanes norvegica TaxID=48144 RepID=A0AAV2R772_MEGNR
MAIPTVKASGIKLQYIHIIFILRKTISASNTQEKPYQPLTLGKSHIKEDIFIYVFKKKGIIAISSLDHWIQHKEMMKNKKKFFVLALLDPPWPKKNFFLG